MASLHTQEKDELGSWMHNVLTIHISLAGLPTFGFLGKWGGDYLMTEPAAATTARQRVAQRVAVPVVAVAAVLSTLEAIITRLRRRRAKAPAQL